MMHLSEAARALGVKLSGQDAEFTAVSTDTRTIKPGSLFVALSGERFDGHDYIQQAIENGAVGVICDREISEDIARVQVTDTRLALGELATYWRQQLNLKLIGLTGSNGKTTLKEMITCILSKIDSVASTRGNLNNDIGLPLTLLEMSKEHRYAVIEMGANHAGEIEYLTHLARPDVAIVNNAGAAHLEGFGTMQGVAQAKGEIFSGLTPDGVAVINVDDEYADYWISLCDNHEKIFFGLDESATVTTSTSMESYDGEFVLETDKGTIDIRLNVLGVHNLRNALAASAACIALGVDLKGIKQGLETFSGVDGRLKVSQLGDGVQVIDDTYNANPTSVKAAIDVLSAIQKPSILVLGDMGELGENSSTLHFQVGEYASSKNIGCMLACGEQSVHTVEGFGQNGFYFDNKEDLISELRKKMNKGVAVLVKGSRSARMEEVVMALTEKNNNSGASSCC